MSAAGKAWIWDFGPESKSDLAKCRECDFLFMTIREMPAVDRTGRAKKRKNGEAERKRSNSGRSSAAEEAEAAPDHVQPTPKKASTPKRPPTVDEVLQKLQELQLQGLTFEDAVIAIKNTVEPTTNIVVEPNADELKKLEN